MNIMKQETGSPRAIADDLIIQYCCSQQRRVLPDVLVTPSVASTLLAINTHNRPVRQQHVEQLAKQIRSGSWRRTHQGIAIGRDGVLLDGQHRLLAVVAAGKSIICDLHFGQDPAAFVVIDTHSKRGCADSLSLAGVTQATTAAAALRVLVEITSSGGDRGTRYSRVTNDEIMSELTKWPTLPHFVTEQRRIRKKIPSFAGALTAAACLISERASVDAVTEFFRRVESGVGATSEDDPALRLRNLLLSPSRPKRATNLAALAIKAWNAHASRKALKLLRWTLDEPFPVPLTDNNAHAVGRTQ